MYKITEHIKRLLIDYDRVIVPGFGVFGLDYTSASVEKDEIIPPAKKLYFEHTIYPNDGLLVRSILKTESSNYTSANALIEKEVFLLKKEIENSSDKKVYLEGLGLLQQTPDGTLQLNASTQQPFFTQGYGYSSISLHPVLTVQHSQKDILTEKETRIEISLRRDFVQKLATIAAILLLIIIFPAKIENGDLATDYAGIIPPMIKIQEKPTKAIGDSVVREQSNDTILSTITITDITFQKQYHIIISSLPSRKIAEKQIERFAQNGIFPLTIVERDNKIRLSIRHFERLDEAEAFLSEFRKNHPELSDAWILSVR
ncbi:MAG TPA: SPOR domain-containing protein [Candidatus Gallibacteroides avistercoris]|uniref:SPOR domain-containing protein n=1 Tax=Candidatus Gallibacteroides avistercoris TaxID=2840833 RepID=A0A9D1SCK5_9BACT|nr:SPOR domain-containing protein [Candidatus Gallibacteroides avistercoris]